MDDQHCLVPFFFWRTLFWMREHVMSSSEYSYIDDQHCLVHFLVGRKEYFGWGSMYQDHSIIFSWMTSIVSFMFLLPQGNNISDEGPCSDRIWVFLHRWPALSRSFSWRKETIFRVREHLLSSFYDVCIDDQLCQVDFFLPKRNNISIAMKWRH